MIARKTVGAGVAVASALAFGVIALAQPQIRVPANPAPVGGVAAPSPGAVGNVSLFDPATQPISLSYYRDTKMRGQFEAMDLNKNGVIEWVASTSTFGPNGALTQLVAGPEPIAAVYGQCVQVQYKKNPPNTKNPSKPGEFLPTNEANGWTTWAESLQSIPRTCSATQSAEVWVCRKVGSTEQYIAENQQDPKCKSETGAFGAITTIYTLAKVTQSICTQYTYGVTRAAWDGLVAAHFARQDFSGDGVLQPAAGPGSERQYLCLPK